MNKDVPGVATDAEQLAEPAPAASCALHWPCPASANKLHD